MMAKYRIQDSDFYKFDERRFLVRVNFDRMAVKCVDHKDKINLFRKRLSEMGHENSMCYFRKVVPFSYSHLPE